MTTDIGANVVAEEADSSSSSLNSALRTFNDIGNGADVDNENNSNDINNQLRRTLSESIHVFDRKSSQSSIQLKSEIEGDENLSKTVDLWDMHSIHTSTLNSSFQQIYSTTQSKDDSTLSTGKSSMQRQFKHIQTNKIPTFEQFVYDKNEPDFIHFQGLSPPICMFQTVCNKLKNNREYYRMLIPPIYEDQNILLLCCRKKKNVNKFRFSCDEFKMEKKNNPYYIGKMKVIEITDKSVTFTVTANNKNGQKIKICSIKIIAEENNSHFIGVTLLSNMNAIESDGKNDIINGRINNFIEPRLNLKILSSNRTILNVTDCVNCIERLQGKSSHISNTMMIDFDYPLDLFISFAITSAINCRHLFLSH